MTVFSLCVLRGSSTWLELARDLAWTVPGNIVGGGILMAWRTTIAAGSSRPVDAGSPGWRDGVVRGAGLWSTGAAVFALMWAMTGWAFPSASTMRAPVRPAACSSELSREPPDSW